MKRRPLGVAGLLAATLAGVTTGVASTPAAKTFDTKAADFAITFHDEASVYKDTSLIVMPGASVVLNAVGGPPGPYTLTTADGTAVQQGVRQWKWTAPDRPGTYLVNIDGPSKKDTIAVHAFVMVPAGAVRNGLLNGYRIGSYPPKPRKGNPIYNRPQGFIEVTRENQDTRVSPHFVLKQFLCKEDTSKSFPKYVVLKERLPLKLEAVLERVNELGFKVDTLHIMSAYRTPYYNHAIGDVLYSTHQFGSAADIYIDPSKTDRMADLNHDGQVDIQDSKFLYDEIESMLAEKDSRRFQGGMGFYPGTSAHPPFVHIDVRGTAARWKG